MVECFGKLEDAMEQLRESLMSSEAGQCSAWEACEQFAEESHDVEVKLSNCLKSLLNKKVMISQARASSQTQLGHAALKTISDDVDKRTDVAEIAQAQVIAANVFFRKEKSRIEDEVDWVPGFDAGGTCIVCAEEINRCG